jgi:hypothetical protein
MNYYKSWYNVIIFYKLLNLMLLSVPVGLVIHKHDYKCEPATSTTRDSVIVGCKMYMTEVLGAKCISRNMLDMKNEKCEPATEPTRDSVIVGCKMYMTKVLGAKCISHGTNWT